MKPSRKSLHLFRADQLFSDPIYTNAYTAVEVLQSIHQNLLMYIFTEYVYIFLSIY